METNDELATRRLEHQIVQACTDLFTGAADEDDDEPYSGCECEIDWNCGCGRYGGFTFIETRYDHLDDGERF